MNSWSCSFIEHFPTSWLRPSAWMIHVDVAVLGDEDEEEEESFGVDGEGTLNDTSN